MDRSHLVYEDERPPRCERPYGVLNMAATRPTMQDRAYFDSLLTRDTENSSQNPPDHHGTC